ncbi:zinc ribbon domain-containing protein [Knoellia koreensis]|uniref:Zinc ribbon domain-containing protein n=1 Tax=Knoellia koreensis TaxID=2730921 RepID=A0A849H644_9MICO|nr:zinc ribbon domain-containing protein [Knoellia sp. DB2414S]NNM45256.1 zinc ribbon domain-containing protein [Knoellia sp. DB2414S]
MSTPTPVSCPRCSAPLPADDPTCPRCGLYLVGPAAAELWQVDQRLAEVTALQTRLRTEHANLLTRRTTLLETLASAPAEPHRTPAPAPAPAPVPAATIPIPTTAAPRRWTVQQTLLAVGVVLVLVSGSIALAVAWDRIGVYGQAVVMGGFTGLAAWLALLLSRRGLASSAEALALVAGGLLLLDVTAARGLGLFGLDAAPADWYAVGSGLAVALVLGALHVRDRRIAAFAILTLTAASVAWGGLVAVSRDHMTTWEVTALLGAVAFGLLHWRLPQRFGLVRRAASGPAAAWLVVAATVAAFRPLLEDFPQAWPTWSTVAVVDLGILLAIWVGGAWVVRAVMHHRVARLGSRAAVRADWAKRWYTGDWRALGVVAVASTLSLPASAWLAAILSDIRGTAVVTALVAVAWVAAVVVRPLGAGRGGWWLESTLGVSALGLAVVVFGQDETAIHVLGLAAVAAGAAATAVRRRPVRLAGSAVAVVFALAALRAGTVDTPPRTHVLLMLGAMAALTAAALWHRRRAEEPALAGGVVLAALLGFSSAASTGDERYGVAVVAMLTAAAAAYAVWRKAFRLIATAVAVVFGLVALTWGGGLVSTTAQVVVLSATGCALTAAALLSRRHEDVTWPLAGGALISLLGGWADAELLHRLEELPAVWLVPPTLAIGGCALAVARVHRRPAVTTGSVAVAVLALWHAVDVAASLGSPELRVLALAGLAAAYAAGALARPHRAEELPLAGGAVLSAGSALWLVLDHGLPTPYLLVVLVVVCAAALATSVLRPALRLPAHGVALASGAWLLWLVGGYGPDGTDIALTTMLALGCVALARWRAEGEEELLFGVGSLVLVVLAVGVADDRGWAYVAAAVAAAYGLALVGYAVRPARRLVVAGAVVALTYATWVALAEAGVETLEAYTVPLALLLLGASAWCRHLLGRRSWLVAGPGLLVGFVPPTLLTVTDAGAIRPLLTAAAAVAVLALGAHQRWQAPVVVGAASAVLVAVSELGPYTLHLPRSVTLGTLGVLLLALGARYEQRRANARQAVSWLASMS